MRPIKIILDSCSDVTRQMMDQYDLDYAKMNTVYRGEQTPASLDWEYYTPQELYGIMRGGERVTTTQVPVEEFDRIFRLYLEKGFDIIYIGCSLKQSGSVNTGTVVAKDLLKEFPDARIECIDSMNSSIGQGMMGFLASDCNKAGDDFDTIVAKVLDIRKRINQFVTVNTLEWLRKAGRVKASSAFFGNLMGVKPILISDVHGYQTALKKVKGRMNSLNEIVDLLKEKAINPEEQIIYMAHSDCTEDELEHLRNQIREKLNPKDIVCVYIGPIIGASVGPDTIGVWAVGDPVTFDVEAGEK